MALSTTSGENKLKWFTLLLGEINHRSLHRGFILEQKRVGRYCIKNFNSLSQKRVKLHFMDDKRYTVYVCIGNTTPVILKRGQKGVYGLSINANVDLMLRVLYSTNQCLGPVVESKFYTSVTFCRTVMKFQRKDKRTVFMLANSCQVMRQGVCH